MTVALPDSPDALRAIIADAQAKLEAHERELRRDVVETIRRMAADVGLEVEIKGQGAMKAKLPAKYRHPATGKTWSGRGRKPAWFGEAALI